MALEWGEARTEIVALSDEIVLAMKNGLPRRKIYRDLLAAGKITMSEPTFYTHLKRLADDVRKPTVPEPVPTSPVDRGHEQTAVSARHSISTTKPPLIAGLPQMAKLTDEDLWGTPDEGGAE